MFLTRNTKTKTAVDSNPLDAVLYALGKCFTVPTGSMTKQENCYRLPFSDFVDSLIIVSYFCCPDISDIDRSEEIHLLLVLGCARTMTMFFATQKSNKTFNIQNTICFVYPQNL